MDLQLNHMTWFAHILNALDHVELRETRRNTSGWCVHMWRSSFLMVVCQISGDTLRQQDWRVLTSERYRRDIPRGSEKTNRQAGNGFFFFNVRQDNATPDRRRVPAHSSSLLNCYSQLFITYCSVRSMQ